MKYKQYKDEFELKQSSKLPVFPFPLLYFACSLS